MSDYSMLMRAHDALKAQYDNLKAMHDAAVAKIAELEQAVTLKPVPKAK